MNEEVRPPNPFEDFDRYCEERSIPMEDTGQAFAQYLRDRFEWTGKHGPLIALPGEGGK